MHKIQNIYTTFSLYYKYSFVSLSKFTKQSQMYDKKRKIKNKPISVMYGLLPLVAKRTGFKCSFISQALAGYYNSVNAHIVRSAALEIIKEIKK